MTEFLWTKAHASGSNLSTRRSKSCKGFDSKLTMAIVRACRLDPATRSTTSMASIMRALVKNPWGRPQSQRRLKKQGMKRVSTPAEQVIAGWCSGKTASSREPIRGPSLRVSLRCNVWTQLFCAAHVTGSCHERGSTKTPPERSSPEWSTFDKGAGPAEASPASVALAKGAIAPDTVS